jgi:hypothetical protein
MSTWRPCADGVVRKHDGGGCEHCPPPPAPEPVRCSETLDIFATPKQAPAQPRPTSEAAAVEISKVLSAKRREVFVAICQHAARHRRGLTDNELIAHFTAQGWSANTPRARRVEVYRAGLITEDGEKDGSTLWTPSALGWEMYAEMPEEVAA